MFASGPAVPASMWMSKSASVPPKTVWFGSVSEMLTTGSGGGGEYPQATA